MVEELAQALHDKYQNQEEEKLAQSLKKLDAKLEKMPPPKPKKFDTYADIAKFGYFGVEKQQPQSEEIRSGNNTFNMVRPDI